MRRVLRLAGIAALSSVLVFGGRVAAYAQDDPSAAPQSAEPTAKPDQTQAPASPSDPPATASPETATSEPTSQPAPSSPDSTPKQVEIPPIPTIAPIAWPYPWLAEAAGAVGKTADQAKSPSAPTTAVTDRATELAAGFGDLSTAPIASSSGDAISAADATGVAATCTYESRQHELNSEHAAIIQMSVTYDDCTTGASQFLISQDVKSGNKVGVILQSSNMNVDVDAVVGPSLLRVNAASAPRSQYGLAVTAADATRDPVNSEAVNAAATSGSATQTGDNNVGVSQTADSATGDAISGTQRLRLTVVGNTDAVTVSAQNASDGSQAATTSTTTDNAAAVAAGADAAGVDPSAAQLGNNTASIDQTALASTGTAEAGSQDIEVNVLGNAKALDVLASNAAEDSVAVSGDATAGNDAAARAGAQATGLGSASAAQRGDNRVGIEQAAAATTGDAIAGAQTIAVYVSGTLGRGGVLASNDASGSLARSGNALVSNGASADSGVLASAGSGPSTAAHAGNNDLAVQQLGYASSGDAIAGAQTISVEAGAIGDLAVLTSNNADNSSALSGTALVFNQLDGVIGSDATSLSAPAVSQQSGSNTARVVQGSDTTSGDAISGATVVGVIDRAAA